MMYKHFIPGDLVSFVRKPKYIVPSGEKPLGIVLGPEKVHVGDPDSGAIMIMIKVKWSICKWNEEDGYSREHPDDLLLVQGVTLKE